MLGSRVSKRRLLRFAAPMAFCLVAACGGGSGGGGVISAPPPAPAPAPAPAPVPAPTPTPTPAPTAAATTGLPPAQAVPSQYNTAEFRRSDGPDVHNAASVWAAGRTGAGVTIAVVDTGVDEDSPEFAGRLSPLSKDVTGQGRPITGSDDHGTNVAMVAAAARDNTGIVGIAHGATVMALRSDTPGSCGADNLTNSDSECSFSDTNIAAAVTYASTNGAKVINISLGGEGASAALQNAVAAAANRGTLIVLSAGNDGAIEPESFARMLDSAAAGGVIIAGSIDGDGSISSFSNRAGSSAAHYLAALGRRICCTYDNGKLYVDAEGYQYLFSGTSFSAPQIAGAAALLAQAFPNLTGRQIADILWKSAFDAGAAGTDPVFGRGILDIYRAFQPIGTTSLAGGTTGVALGDTSAAASPAMGDALARVHLNTVVLDEYRRAFGTDLAGTARSAAPEARLAAAIGGAQRQVAMSSPTTSVAFSIDDHGRTGQLRLGQRDADTAQVLAARIATQLAPDLRLGFAYAEGADGVVAQLQGQDSAAFLVAPTAAGDDGMVQHGDAAVALRQQWGAWGLTASAARGESLSGAPIYRAAEMRGRRARDEVATFGLAADRRFGPVETTLGLTLLREDRTLLGARFHDALGLAGADTVFLDAGAGWTLAPGWRLGGSLRQGWTSARGAGISSMLTTRAWSFDVERRGVFGATDRLGLRVSRPLRVEGGALNLTLPSGWDYATEQAEYAVTTLALSPTGHETMAELAWRGPLWGGFGAASLFYRQDPGHYATLPADKGMAMKWSARF